VVEKKITMTKKQTNKRDREEATWFGEALFGVVGIAARSSGYHVANGLRLFAVTILYKVTFFLLSKVTRGRFTLLLLLVASGI
jgi:hypothetical protein